MATIDNVGPNIFVDTGSANRGFGPRKYVRPSFKQCRPPRLYHFKKNDGVPLPGQKPFPVKGDVKPQHKQGVFYKDIKHIRCDQLQGSALEHELRDQIDLSFLDIVWSDVGQHGWLDNARRYVTYVVDWVKYIQDMDRECPGWYEQLARERREQREERERKERRERREQRARKERDEAKEMRRREQAMREGIALNSEQRRQMLLKGRNMILQSPTRHLESSQSEQSWAVANANNDSNEVLHSPPSSPTPDRSPSPAPEGEETEKDAEGEEEDGDRSAGSAGEEQADIDVPLLALAPPHPARERYIYTHTDAVEGWTATIDIPGNYENPVEARWHNLERYEARDQGVLTEQETLLSWRKKDYSSLTPEQRILRDEEDLERERRDMQQASCEWWAAHERSKRDFEARMAAINLPLPTTPTLISPTTAVLENLVQTIIPSW